MGYIVSHPKDKLVFLIATVEPIVGKTPNTLGAGGYLYILNHKHQFL